jgi:D-alanyl-D-alanine endopeptidase (penicillin-binding protein 7)
MKKILLGIFISAVCLTAHGYNKSVSKYSFSAKSYLIADQDGQILKEQQSEVVRPIASISKLMIALISVDHDLEEQLLITTPRKVQSSIPIGVKYLTRRELLTLALVKSDNLAAQTLCDNLVNCVDTMNNTARDLGMKDTHYAEPTGLDRENVSTAQDLLKLLMTASTNETIKEISSMSTAEIYTDKKVIKVNNTNPLTSRFDVILSKTGFTVPAGGCLVMIIRSQVGQRILILLGSKNARTRIPDMITLVKGIQ